MKLNLKTTGRKIYGYGKQKALPVFLATTLAINSMLAGMPVLNVAEAASPEITAIAAEYVQYASPDYTGVYVGFTETEIIDAKSIELRLNRENGEHYSTFAQQSVLDAVNASPNPYGTGGTVIVTGSRTSGSWAPQTGTWAGADRLRSTDSVEVVITLTDNTIISKALSLESSITNQAIEDDVFASTPKMTSVDAYYSSKVDYTAISADFRVENITNANSVELRVNRSDSSTYSIFAKQSVLDSINTGVAKTITGPIVLTGSRTSGSWTDQTGTWVGDALPVSVDVIITLADDNTFSMRDDFIGETKAAMTEVLPKARNASDNISYTSIQAAINASATDSGETIEAFNGTHGSFGTSFGGDADLTIMPFAGAAPIIEASTTGTTRIVDLRADGTTFKGFTIRSLMPGANVGISMSGQDLTVQDNTIENTLTGIQTTTQYNVGSSLIQNNVVNSAYGISLQNDSNTVIKNDITSTVEGFGVIGLNNIIEWNNIDATSGNQAVAYGGIALNVIKNWWGNVNGPTSLVSNVDGDPWLCQPWQTSTSIISVNGSCDFVAPTAPTITAPADGSFHTSTPIQATWDAATDDSAITNYQVAYRYDDGHTFGGSTCAVGEVVDGQVVSGCRTVGNVLSRNHVPNTGEQGGVTIWVRAIDEHGNEGDWSEPVRYFYDETAPTVNGVVLNGQSVNVARTENCGPTDFNLVGGKIDLSATISDNIDVQNARYKIRKVTDGGCTQTAIYQSNTVSMQNSGSNQWITLPGSQIDTAAEAGLVDGNYTIQITTKDLAGNTSTSYVDITVDNTAPDKIEGMRILFNGQDMQCSGFINGRTITVDWDDSNEPGVRYEYHNKDKSLFDNLTVSEFTGNIRDEDGFYQYKVRAIDAIGNVGEWSDWCGVTLDQVAPVADITSHENGDVVRGEVQLVGGVVDANPMNSYFKITGPSYTKTSLYKDGRNVHEFTWDTNGLVDGIYTIQFEARDKADNKEMPGVSVDTIQVEVDNSAPSILILEPAENSVHNDAFEFKVKGVDTESGLSQFVANLKSGDGSNLAPCINTNANGVEEFTASCMIDTTKYSDGNYSIKTNIRDVAGNLSQTLTLHFTIDNTKPVISNASLSDDVINSTDIDPILTADVDGTSSNVASAQYRIHTAAGDKIDGFGWVDLAANGGVFDAELISVSGTVQTAGLADGDYIVRVRAHDAAGNKRSGIDLPLIVDRTAPELTINEVADVEEGEDVVVSGNSDEISDVIVTVDAETKTATPNSSSGDWTVTFSGLTAGTYTAEATTSDAAGNVASATSNEFEVTEVEEELIDDEEGESEPTPTPTPSNNTSQGQTLAEQIKNKVKEIIKNVQDNIFGAFGLNSNNPTPQDGNNEDEEEDEDSEEFMAMTGEGGDVAGESASNDEFKVVGSANDEGCSSFFGLCWYFWVPVVIAVSGGAVYLNNRRLATANSNTRRRR